jgi:biotin transport system substrate-specific component
MTYADILRPATRTRALLYDLTLILLFSFLIAALAQVAFPLPFSPVPITGQTLGVLLAGFLLGSRRGFGAALAYLAEGAAGLPVFAGGTAGVSILVGPTGGYLVGFLAAAYVVGLLAEHGWDRDVPRTLLGMAIGNLIIYLFGITWLSTFMGGLGAALSAGLAPFLVGDVLKIALAAALLPLGWRLIPPERFSAK